MKFPVVIKTKSGDSSEEVEARKSKLHYRVASTGIYQVRESDSHRSVTLVTNPVPGLPGQDEQLELRIPRLPEPLVGKILGFFNEVYLRHGGEAIVFLFYNNAKRTYRVGVPPQRIAGYYDWHGEWRAIHHLDYESMARPEGFVLFGSIHSHANMQAYASHTDEHDERDADGLHIVFGNFDRKEISRSASFVAGGRRFKIDPDRVLEPCEVPEAKPPAVWMEQVVCEEERSTYYSYGYAGTTRPKENGSYEN